MKFGCKVIGHELVKKGTAELVRVTLRGTDAIGMKVELLVEKEDRDKYPFEAQAVVDFNVRQQGLDLVGEAEAPRTNRRGKGDGASASAN
jgi:hypothetical protein